MTNLDELEELERKATKGPWRAMADGNQYIETEYVSTAKCVSSARVEGIRRPWNPHALLAFGFKPSEYETARFLEDDAALIVALRNEAVPMIQELRELREENARAIAWLDRMSWANATIDTKTTSKGPLEIQLADALAERDALRAEVEGLKEKLKDDQERVDAVVYYRNLAIVLGAKPNQMRGESDSKLCEMGIDPDDDEGGYSVSMNDVIHENEKLWEAVGEVAELRAQLATAREDALEEAARMLAIFSDTSARHHAESIRALKKTKGG